MAQDASIRRIISIGVARAISSSMLFFPDSTFGGVRMLLPIPPRRGPEGGERRHVRLETWTWTALRRLSRHVEWRLLWLLVDSSAG